MKMLLLPGFSNEIVKKINVILTYRTKQTSFEVTIVEPVTAKNSNFDNAKCEVLGVKSYAFTDPAKQEYITMEIEINDIIRNTDNDTLEYYYYLSSSKSESNIQNWVKITETQANTTKLTFKISTKDIANYDEVINADILYIYIREIAVKGGDQKTLISNSMQVQSNAGLEEYLDGVKQDPNTKQDDNTGNETNTGKDDDTVSKDRIPNAGKKVIFTIVVIGIAGLGIICLGKYKKLKDVK